MTTSRERGRVGVCSWSLQPESAADLVQKVRATGVSAVQLHLDPIRTGAWKLDETAASLRDAGIAILSGMMSMKGEDYSTLESIRETGGVRPTSTWPDNLLAAAENAAVAQQLGVTLVTFHAGFLPHEAQNAERLVMIDRLREFAEVFRQRGARIALETGQESAETLIDVLLDVNRGLDPDFHVRVNFDPANMILYGMGEPVAALQQLAPHVSQLHIKDALPGPAGRWGEEVPVGEGAVNWRAFLSCVQERVSHCNLLIEREAGATRVEDIRKAARVLTSLGAGA
jgi:L-ribulose-5-phosphate 3-epimerase